MYSIFINYFSFIFTFFFLTEEQGKGMCADYQKLTIFLFRFYCYFFFLCHLFMLICFIFGRNLALFWPFKIF